MKLSYSDTILSLIVLIYLIMTNIEVDIAINESFTF